LRFGIEIIGIGLSTILFIFLLLKLYIKYCRNKNPKYNQFGKAPLSRDEKTFLSKWQFEVSGSLHEITQQISPQLRENNNGADD